MENISDILRLSRSQKNYTQEYVAFKLGISQSQYNKIEKGDVQLTVERLVLIASVLELNKEDFLGKVFDVNFKHVQNINGNSDNEHNDHQGKDVTYYKMVALHYEKKFLKLYKKYSQQAQAI